MNQPHTRKHLAQVRRAFSLHPQPMTRAQAYESSQVEFIHHLDAALDQLVAKGELQTVEGQPRQWVRATRSPA